MKTLHLGSLTYSALSSQVTQLSIALFELTKRLRICETKTFSSKKHDIFYNFFQTYEATRCKVGVDSKQYRIENQLSDWMMNDFFINKFTFNLKK